MEIQVKQPVVVGIPLDDTMPDVIEAAVTMARKLDTTLVPGHAIAPYPFPTARHSAQDAEVVKDRIRAALSSAISEGKVAIADPVVAESAATPFLLGLADRTHAQMLVVGGVHGATVGGWVMGTVADRVVRTGRCPVLIARGLLPGPDRPILCPVDLTPQAHLGLEAALRMARRFDAPLRVITVLPKQTRSAKLDKLDGEAEHLERATHEELWVLVRKHDVRDVQLSVDVVAGNPAKEIIDAAQRCFLVVLASRAFDLLVPASVGDVASRVLRNVTCSVLALRDLDPDVASREKQLAHVVDLRNEARKALEDGELDRAERALRIAQSILPGHAVLEDDLAAVLDRAGKKDAADRHRAAARILRSFHT